MSPLKSVALWVFILNVFLSSMRRQKNDSKIITRPTWTATMQHIAKEGRCFVINCNQFCTVSDFPPDYPPFAAENPSDSKPDGSKWESNDILSHGGSCIIGPLGTMITEPVWDREEIVYAELKMGELTEARMDFDAVGSYSRPDIFELRFNEREAANVIFGE